MAVGADHKGFVLKEYIKRILKEQGYEVIDKGTYSEESVDYPDFAFKVAESVSKGESDRGILICYTGIGMEIAANKIKGIRAALAFIPELAKLTRNHNDSNILTFGSYYMSPYMAQEVVLTWLKEKFEAGRHKRRVDKISNRENL